MTPVILIPGTFWKDVASWAETYALTNKPVQSITKIFGAEPLIFDWSGANSPAERHATARRLADFIRTHPAPVVHLLGFSHGGNVACEAAAIVGNRVDLLITIATPVTGGYKTGGSRRHIHLYSPKDRMQIIGGEGPLGMPCLAAREFPNAENFAIEGILSSDFTGSHGNILWSDQTWRILETLH